MSRRKIYYTLLVALLIILFFVAINTGYARLSISEIFSIIIGKGSAGATLIFLEFRLPRVLIVILIGCALAIAGSIMQIVSQNDLADPGILGINAGAGLVIAIMIASFNLSFFFSEIYIFIFAFIGAIMTALFIVYFSFNRTYGLNKNNLVLAGIAITQALNALTIIILKNMTKTEYNFIAGWLSGNLWGVSWANILILSVGVGAILVYVIYKRRVVDILNLGKDTAISLGVNVNKEALLLLICAVGLAGMCVAVGGGITFIGLICPHIAKKIFGSKFKFLLPGTALIGINLLLLSDIISRGLISPKEISIGIVATVLGAPYFIYLLVTKRESVRR